MAEVLVPTSELEAVNAILSTIGETPINDLAETNSGDVERAKVALKKKTREILKKGFWFNEETVDLSATDDGTIEIPSSYLSVQPYYPNERDTYVTRGTKLYDRENNTDQITGPVKVNVRLSLAFDTLPEVAREAIFKAAGRLFCQETIGDRLLYEITKTDARAAWADLHREDLRMRPRRIAGGRYYDAMHHRRNVRIFR